MRSKIAIAIGVLALLQMRVHSQVAVGAGSQLGHDYLATGTEKSTGNTMRRSMIISWVQGYIVCYAQCITREPLAAEVAQRIEHGDLPPNVDQALSDPRVLRTLQAKFRTVSGWLFDPPNGEAIEAWLTKYFEQHPSNRISEAAAVFAGELETRNKKTNP